VTKTRRDEGSSAHLRVPPATPSLQQPTILRYLSIRWRSHKLACPLQRAAKPLAAYSTPYTCARRVCRVKIVYNRPRSTEMSILSPLCSRNGQLIRTSKADSRALPSLCGTLLRPQSHYTSSGSQQSPGLILHTPSPPTSSVHSSLHP